MVLSAAIEKRQHPTEQGGEEMQWMGSSPRCPSSVEACRRICIGEGLANNDVRISGWLLLCVSNTKEATTSPLSKFDSAANKGCGTKLNNDVDDGDSSGSNRAEVGGNGNASSMKSDLHDSVSRSEAPAGTTNTSSSSLSETHGDSAVVSKRKEKPVDEDVDAKDHVEEGYGDSAQPVDALEESSTISDSWGADLPANCHARVIVADVKRSLWKLYPNETVREKKRKMLCNILAQILSNNPERHYYQGLHEMVGFVMYVMEGAREADIVAVCSRLLVQQWRSFSCKQLERSQSMMYAMHTIVVKEEKILAEELEACSVGPESHYAMPWLITWYTHVCDDVEALSRLFDFLVASEDENTVIFFTAALMLHEREQIIGIIKEVKSSCCDCDDSDGTATAEEINKTLVMAQVYSRLVRLPKEVLRRDRARDLESIIRRATVLHEKYLSYANDVRGRFMRNIVSVSTTSDSSGKWHQCKRWLRFSLERRWVNAGFICIIAIFAFWYRESTSRGVTLLGNWITDLYTVSCSIRSSVFTV
ncbi:TBC1 domain family member 20/GTPase, putative [Trypanosoma equiperdum]|uniref:GTPase activating protein of Rab-like GTPase, putative n=2 Tax=Trypanozoon TaxID=39700 RepID=Q4GYQ1_TRYB2|nr:GTPase activating protein of Rab-like GTPase, putative [Trypanosoma brucei brucei TREU927]CAJ16533.1 GTPase activating protein of Rab-like GTPase, putative [Trypanosoma brucei brucei TREU927]SCU67476.1 TBC1 domain family member 20/GTPase, putative [Trypanosoma equiperdum]